MDLDGVNCEYVFDEVCMLCFVSIRLEDRVFVDLLYECIRDVHVVGVGLLACFLVVRRLRRASLYSNAFCPIR